ncbi:MAG TPA: hypothetical protein VMG32_13470 [Anaeromyxobacteraceae bacterium]|nr:hypothetical protein [Anaeromyxobacteraceae bacterium]
MTAPEHNVHFEVSLSLQRRVVRARLAGLFSVGQMQALAAALSQATHQFRGARHMLVVDMRGLRPLDPHLAKILAEIIVHGRRSGCVLCVHLSDSTVQRLRAHQVTRESSPSDDFTVDVSSDLEAERVTEEARSLLDDGRYGASVRDAVAA